MPSRGALLFSGAFGVQGSTFYASVFQGTPPTRQPGRSFRGERGVLKQSGERHGEVLGIGPIFFIRRPAECLIYRRRRAGLAMVGVPLPALLGGLPAAAFSAYHVLARFNLNKG